MDPNWWFDKFGTVGLMLAAMVWDRTRLLKQQESLQQRIDTLTDRLIQQSQDAITRRMESDRASIENTERMMNALTKLREGN